MPMQGDLVAGQDSKVRIWWRLAFYRFASKKRNTSVYKERLLFRREVCPNLGFPNYYSDSRLLSKPISWNFRLLDLQNEGMVNISLHCQVLEHAASLFLGHDSSDLCSLPRKTSSMMQFGKYLEEKQRAEWASNYVDYKFLKDLIKDASKQQEEAVSVKQ